MKSVLATIAAAYIATTSTLTMFILSEQKENFCRIESRLNSHIQDRIVHK